MRIGSRLLLCVALAAMQLSVFGQSAHILMDGEFSDWESLAFVYSDSVGDAGNTGVDFGGLKVANDDLFLYLLIELNHEVNLQSNLNATLYIDTDNDDATGQKISNLGAELNWTFGRRVGYYYSHGDSVELSPEDIRLRTSPTLSSEIFEICLGLGSFPDSANPLFLGDTIGIFIIDHDNGDIIPDGEDKILYVLDHTPLEPTNRIPILKADEEFLRVLSWNVHGDDLFEPSKLPSYMRVLRAIKPDIICFQEIYAHSAGETREIVESILPSRDGQSWHTDKRGTEVVIVSRYPIMASWEPDSANGAFLISLTPTYDSDLLIFNVHFPCCDNEAGREQEIDGTMAFLRDAQQQGGELTLAEQTPVIITGDMNLVGDRRRLETLLTGNISDNGRWGEDFSPDWDESELTDAVPRHTDLLQTYTWRNDGNPGGFSPGRLDYMIYTDAVLRMEGGYLLWTGELSEDTLSAYGLDRTDTEEASDHLPVVADFSLILPLGMADNSLQQVRFNLHHNYPNPFNATTTMTYALPRSGKVVLTVHDLLGREVTRLVEGYRPAGENSTTWDASNFTSGIYFYHLQAGEFVQTRKMVLLK